MRIDAQLVTRLEELSCLRLTDSERVRIEQDLRKILSDVMRLGELGTENIPECSHPFACVNGFREDETQPSMSAEEILRNAPERFDTLFVAPKTVE